MTYYFMSSFDPFFNKCLDVLKRPEVQKDLNAVINPFIKAILSEMYLYIYPLLFIILVNFILLLGILLLLLRNKSILTK
jgi:hypothetical protein